MKNIKLLLLIAFSMMLSLRAMGAVEESFAQRLAKEKSTVLAKLPQQNGRKSLCMNTPINTLPDAGTMAYTWGVIGHENGTTWFYTQTFEERKWSIDASEITIFDNTFQQVAKLRVEIPEDLNVNDIHPTQYISSSFFDTDASNFELPIYVHAVDNGTQISKIYVYHLDSGEKIQEYNSRSMIQFIVSDDYERMIMIDDSSDNTYVSILKGAEGEQGPVVEKTFIVDKELLNYNNGPVLNYYAIDNEPYYCISHYEKPCMEGIDMESYIPTQAPNNYLLIKTYDRNYTMIDSLRISIDPINPEATYGFASLGLLSYKDMRIGDFTGDNRRNYIVTHYDYFAQSDDFVYTFRVYDQDCNLVDTIYEGTSSWFALSNLEGHEEQYSFLCTRNDGVQVLDMVDIPSCNVVASFEPVIDGYRISSTFDRYPVGDDYQYVFAIGQGELDAEGNVLSRIAWYNRDCSVDHYVTFNIGKNGEGFTPYIASYVLNPYLFNTDSKREYFFLAMNKRDDGSEILDKTLYLADEDGKILRTMKPSENEKEIEFSSGDIFDYNTPNPTMVLSFYNGESEGFEVLYYNLPLDSFTSGGDGSQENPYVITTPGELAFMHKNSADAHYVLGNDIDMSDYPSPYYAPAQFSGSFDGNNYVIKNLQPYNSGLLNEITGASIKNLQIQSPVLFANGVLANTANNATIENVHIYDANIYTNSESSLGCVVNSANNTQFTALSMLRAYVDEFDTLGGVVANATNCTFNAIVTSGIMQLGKTFGGIAVNVDGSIANSHVNWEGTALQATGGIAAFSTANITNCFSQGVYDYLVNSNGIGNVAGIVYNQESGKIKNCVTALNNIVVTLGNEASLENNYSENIDKSNDANSTIGAFVAFDELNKTFFEGIGYAYGNNNDAPWSGEALPILYFENERQHEVAIETDKDKIKYDGFAVEASQASQIQLFNTQGILVASVTGQSLNVSQISNGIYIVVATENNGNCLTRKIVVK